MIADSQICEPADPVLTKPPHVRWLVRRHMPEVLTIERASFEFPWFEEDFVRCLRQRNVIAMVACDGGCDGPVLGFMVYELHSTRVHLLNFAVLPEARRLGVGRALVKALTNKLHPQRRKRVTLEIRETNLPAQQFFRSCGFKAVTVLRSYYEDSPEDAYLMQWRLPTEEI